MRLYRSPAFESRNERSGRPTRTDSVQVRRAVHAPHVIHVLRAVAGTCALWGSTANAQMPGVPVLQGAFVNPGVTLGAFFAGGKGQTAGGIAGALAPARQWAQITGGAGYGDARSTVYTYGGRLAIPVGRFIPGVKNSERFGVAAFAGAGGGTRDSVTLLMTPAGVAFGYRRALGATRAINVFVSPFLSWNRSRGEGLDQKTAAAFRAAAGADVALTERIGVTVGWEGGRAATETRPGPRGSLFGAGLSYAFR
jgi:hypothetical protein